MLLLDYPAVIDKTAIPLLLIHPRCFFDGPDYLETSWNMNYLTGFNSKNHSISTRLRQTPTSIEPEILKKITEGEY